MRRKTKQSSHYFTASPKSRKKPGLIRSYLRGRPFEFLTMSGVFSKKRVDSGTRLLINSMILPEQGFVLDVGCGYGAVGIAAAVTNPCLYVFMVDVNERAVWLAKRNVKLNNVTNAETRRGYLYEPVNDLTFNCILSNPPVSAGMNMVKEIIVEASKYMAEKASFQMVVKSKVAGKRLTMLFEEAFGNINILARKGGYRVLVSEKQ